MVPPTASRSPREDPTGARSDTLSLGTRSCPRRRQRPAHSHSVGAMTLPHAPDVQALLRSVRADVTALLEVPRQTPPPTTATQPQRSKGPPPLPTPILERARVVCSRSEVVETCLEWAIAVSYTHLT